MTSRKVLITYKIEVVRNVNLEDYENLDTYEAALQSDIDAMENGEMMLEECIGYEIADTADLSLVDVRVEKTK
jgi:hypothetical protein